MSYDIQLFRTETMEREQNGGDENFFDDEQHLEPFTPAQFNALRERLEAYGYEGTGEGEHGLSYRHAAYSISVLLTQSGLYFTAGWNQDAIFEAGMTASEFTDTGTFAKYDPQNGGWEIL